MSLIHDDITKRPDDFDPSRYPSDERMISYYDEFAVALVNVAADYILKLRKRIPDLNRHTISDDEAFVCWAYYLSMLGLEANWSVVQLIRANAVHIAYGITRSLFEYLTKLEYYAQRKDQARVAYASIGERVLYHGNNYNNLSSEMIEEMRRHQRLWKSNEPTSSFKVLLNFTSALQTVAPENAKRLLTEFYETPSGFVHGSGHTMPDILGRSSMADSTYSPNKTQSDACLHFLCMLSVLRDEFPSVFRQDDSLDEYFAKYVELAGDHILWKDVVEGFD
jgi:hypothetical protein